MCGIAGIFHFKNKRVDETALDRMSLSISHRGPDGHGKVVERNIGLINRRLAIIDPTMAARQPMSTADGNLWITYNGEIFNYRQIRNDLIKKGYKFRSHSDTETILYGYKEYGSLILDKLIGQFAFCIWDRRNNRFFLARDQLGINPLYYAVVDNTFLFCSEVKGLLASGFIKKTINISALYHYLSMYTIPAPATIFENVKSLLPGHRMIVDENGIKLSSYWKIPIGLWKEKKVDKNILVDKLRETLISSIRHAKTADVPIGAFLSGGIDSSTMVALMAKAVDKPIKTFSLWAEGGEDYDERKYARAVAERYKTDHIEYEISEKEVIKELPKIVYNFDQPTGGSFENYFISKLAREKVKVALSGLGGDELFGGYHSIIYRTKVLSNIYRFFPDKLLRVILAFTKMSPFDRDLKKTIAVADKFLRIPGSLGKRLLLYFAFEEEEKKNLFHKSFLPTIKDLDTTLIFERFFGEVKNYSDIDQLEYIDLMTYTRDDLLLGTNMMSMANSLEVRVPFLDTKLVRLAAEIPPWWKYKNGITKYLLKEVVKEWLPDAVINHKKTGFGLPRARYMRSKLKPYIISVLSRESIERRGLFDYPQVQNAVNQFYNAPSEKMLWVEHLRVWILFVFELWCRIYLDRNKIEVPDVSLSDLCG
jgi:asparagine synthase (glutamine-hydrolysing)